MESFDNDIPVLSSDSPIKVFKETPPEWPSAEEFSPFVILRYRDIPSECYRLLDKFEHGVNKFGIPVCDRFGIHYIAVLAFTLFSR
jgi:hypothetical protein